MKTRISLTQQAHDFIRQALTEGDFAIDATVGNGNDTLFLAKQIGKQGIVFGFDIQQKAIDSTRSKLESENITANIKLFHVCHSQMDISIPSQHQGRIKAIMFNLGYLPGSDKTVITQTESTLIALNKSIELLSATGIISITAYPGHAGGKAESMLITRWSKQLDPILFTTQVIYSSSIETAPRLIIINKI